MRKQTFLIPTLSALLFSTAILSNKTYANEANLATGVDGQVDSIQVSQSQEEESSQKASSPSSQSSSTDSSSEEESQTQKAKWILVNPQSDQEPTTPESQEKTSQADSQAPASKSSQDITILHTNDVHGRMVEDDKNGVIGDAKLASVVEASRQQGQTLVFDAGDSFQGLPISNSSQGENMADVMNSIGYDAMTVGNHEFDFGLYQLKRLKAKLQFPIISSNIYVNGTRLFEPSTIIDKTPDQDGDEFVVIGVTTPETATKTHPDNIKGVTFADPITEVNNVIAQTEANAKAQGKTYHNYVILSHLGVDATTKTEWRGDSLAQALAQNELLKDKNVIVIDGHSHTVLQLTDGHVTYNQTGSYLHNIGYITLNSDRVLSAGVLSADQLENVTPDPAVAGLLEKIQAKYEAESAQVIREDNPVELNGDRMNVRVRETNLGDLVVDSLLAYGQTGFSHKSNLAVTNGGGLRETLKTGQPITKGDVIAVLPFGNTVTQIQVTGQNIDDMFRTSLGSIVQVDKDNQPILDEEGNPILEPSGGFLQVSGARVYYDTNLDPDKRIHAIEVWDPESEIYLPLDLSKTYYLATNDFLAAGGDNYTMLGGPRQEGPSMDQVLEDYLKSDIDLLQYKEINPNKRLISILALHYYDPDWIKKHIGPSEHSFKPAPLAPRRDGGRSDGFQPRAPKDSKPDSKPNLNPNDSEKPEGPDQPKIDGGVDNIPDEAPSKKSDATIEQKIPEELPQLDKAIDISKLADKPEEAMKQASDKSEQMTTNSNKPTSQDIDLPDVSSQSKGLGANSAAGSSGRGQSGSGSTGSRMEASAQPHVSASNTADNTRFNEVLVSFVGVTVIAAGAVVDHLRVRRHKWIKD